MPMLSAAKAATIAVAIALVPAVSAQAATGDLTQKPGTAACVSDSGAAPCADGDALVRPNAVAVSPDGANVYFPTEDSDAITVFDRAPDGTLTQKAGSAGCISETGSPPCADGVELDGAYGATVSPSGTSVYVVSRNGSAITVFDRAPNGTLTQKPGTAGCISFDGSGGACAVGTAIDGAGSVAVSPDGATAYVTAQWSGAVAVFDRASNGALTQKAGTAGCVSYDGAGPCAAGVGLSGASSVTLSPDATSVYVASAFTSRAVAVFDRASDGTLTQKGGTAACISEDGAGPCADGVGLDYVQSVSVSPDGSSVYAASQFSSAVAVFDRASDGTLTQKAGTAGCFSDDGSSGSCATGSGLDAASAVTTSPDGASVYVASIFGGVAVFQRASDGTLAQEPGADGCIGLVQAGCTPGSALYGAVGVAVSPDGTSVYVAALFDDAVAVLDREVPPPPPTPPPPAPPTPLVPVEGKPSLELVGKAGRTRSRVRIGCGDAAACRIVLSGIRSVKEKTGRANARTRSKRTVALAAGQSRTISLGYTGFLARTIERALNQRNPISPKIRVTARETGRLSRSIVISVDG